MIIVSLQSKGKAVYKNDPLLTLQSGSLMHWWHPLYKPYSIAKSVFGIVLIGSVNEFLSTIAGIQHQSTRDSYEYLYGALIE